MHVGAFPFCLQVPEAGLEPARAQCPRDFKSLVSTIPPFRRIAWFKKRSSCRTSFLSCGGPTRTGDLQVMSLASYQLLHPAMLCTALVSQMRCKGKDFFPITQIKPCFFYILSEISGQSNVITQLFCVNLHTENGEIFKEVRS